MREFGCGEGGSSCFGYNIETSEAEMCDPCNEGQEVYIQLYGVCVCVCVWGGGR